MSMKFDNRPVQDDNAQPIMPNHGMSEVAVALAGTSLTEAQKEVIINALDAKVPAETIIAEHSDILAKLRFPPSRTNDAA